jgi:hypothetical protein
MFLTLICKIGILTTEIKTVGEYFCKLFYERTNYGDEWFGEEVSLFKGIFSFRS